MLFGEVSKLEKKRKLKGYNVIYIEPKKDSSHFGKWSHAKQAGWVRVLLRKQAALELLGFKDGIVPRSCSGMKGPDTGNQHQLETSECIQAEGNKTSITTIVLR